MKATARLRRSLACPRRSLARLVRCGPLSAAGRRRLAAGRAAAAGAAAEVSFAAAVEGRASVRSYLSDAVAREDVVRMVGLATRAASAGNAQSWRFVAVEDRTTRARMRAAVEAKLDEMAAWPEAADLQSELRAVRGYATFFGDAPLVVAVFALPYVSRIDRVLTARGLPDAERDRLRQRPEIQSVGAAVQLLITAAHALGYGACWMSAPVVACEEIEHLLGVASPAKLVALVPVGRPAQRPAPRRRLPLAQVLRFR